MAISSPGIGSNLDVNSIVSQLMTIEQRPLVLLAQKESTQQARLSSLGTIKGALSSLQTAAGSLKSAGTVSFSATSSDTSSVAASASASAVPGSYSVNVTQLAQAQRLVAAGQASESATIGGGADTTLTFSFGTISGGTFASGTYTGASFAANADKQPFSVTIDATNNSLTGIRDAINAANGGVTASIVNDGGATPYRLSLSVKDTGAASSLKIAVSGEAALGTLLAQDPAGTQQLSETVTAKDALLTVDGTSVTRSTNAVSGAIPGVTLALSKTTTAPVTITVARSFTAATTALTALVKAYNDYNGVNATATGKGAVFQGDGVVLSVQQRVRAAIGGNHAATGAFRNLSAVGVSFQKDGTLALDQGKLSAALASDPAGALATIAAAGNSIKSLTDSALGAKGTIQSSTDGINRSLAVLESRRDDLVRRLENTEKRLRTQFTALDSLISRMNQTSAFLQQQLDKLPSPTDKG